MFFRNFAIVGLLGCVALQSAYSQDSGVKSDPASGPNAAGPIAKPAESFPALKKFFNDGGNEPTSPDAVFSKSPNNVTIIRSPELQQIVFKAGQAGDANCVGPGPADCKTNACAPPLTAAAADCCKPCLLRHRNAIFADYLYLSATGVDLPYALPVDGLGPVNVLRGAAAMADNTYDSGFRVGGIVALDDCTSVMAQFWHFQSSDGDSQNLPGGGGSFYQATLTDPGTMNVAADSLMTRSTYDIDFNHIDLVVRRALIRTQTTMFNAVAGVRYSNLKQELLAEYSILGDTAVQTEIDFNGVGPRLGFEGEYVHCSGFLLYANAHANFLVGQFRGDYVQDNIFAGTQSYTSFVDNRVVTQLEMELGAGWQSKCGRFRFTAGYYIASWRNIVSTSEFIQGVQNRHLANLHDDIGFNGLTVRAMIQF